MAIAGCGVDKECGGRQCAAAEGHTIEHICSLVHLCYLHGGFPRTPISGLVLELTHRVYVT